MTLALVAVLVGRCVGFGLLTRSTARRRSRVQMSAEVGIFYGSISGSAEDVAERIKEVMGDVADGPFDIEEDGTLESLAKYKKLVVGLPTYNTGADTMRSGTEWDELYYNAMQEMDFAGTKVACFGVGDQEGYGENFAEGVGEIHDVFEAKGAQMFGYTDASEAAGYFHEESKTQRGDKFVGLVCDNANQDDMTDGRVAAWCAQLRSEGFLTGGSVVAPEPVAQVEAAPEASKIEKKNVAVAVEELASVAGPPEEIEAALAEALAKEAAEYPGWKPHHSSTIGQTLWIKKDDYTKSFYTFDKKK